MDTGIPSFPQLTYTDCVELGYTRLDASWAEFEFDTARCIAKLTGGPHPQVSQQDRDCIVRMSLEKHLMFTVLALALWLLWRRTKREPGQRNAKSE